MQRTVRLVLQVVRRKGRSWSVVNALVGGAKVVQEESNVRNVCLERLLGKMGLLDVTNAKQENKQIMHAYSVKNVLVASTILALLFVSIVRQDTCQALALLSVLPAQ